MELSLVGRGYRKMRKMMSIETMKMLGRKRLIPIDTRSAAPRMLGAVVFAAIAATAGAQTVTPDVPKHDAAPQPVPPKSSPPADEALPSGNPHTGVLKPPDVDPKMAKQVPDVDPAMDNPPPGKPPAPEAADPPKVQPK